MKPVEQLLGLAARDSAGLVVAALLALLGAAIGLPWAWAVWTLALAAALASLRHLGRRAAVARRYPPPGRRVDIGGYAVHVLAEGQADAGRPAIVWFGGGHSGGSALLHLHRELKRTTRSILIDRPGTGWSDTGPFPRSTAREADEIVRALQAAGEGGPFVLAGHSFGGLLCANIARRHPQLVHTLVLLDPTPLETIVFGPRLGALAEMRRAAWTAGAALWFGIDLGARRRAEPALAGMMRQYEQVLGAQAVQAAYEVEARAGVPFAQFSIFRELSPQGVAACGWETVVYDGDLGAVPLYLVAPKDDADVQSLPELRDSSPADAQRMANFFARTRERYLAASSNSRRVVAPAGSGHNFVYEVPEFVVALMRDIVAPPPGEALR